MKYIIFILISTLFIACQRQLPYAPEAIALNNRAVSLLESKPDKAIQLLDSAHMLDSTYLLPLQNKVNLLIKNKRYIEGITAIDQLLVQLKAPEVWQMKGLLLYKTHDTQSATYAFEKSLQLYREQLVNGQSNNKYASKYQIGICLLLLGNYDEGIQLIEKYGKMIQQPKEKLDNIILHAQDIPALVDELLL